MRRLSLFVVLALGLAVLATALRPASSEPSGPAADTADTPALTSSTPAEPLVDPGRCVEAAYLCAGLEERGQERALRWSDRVTVLRVRVLRPEHEPPARADSLQRAAARGVRAWQGQPFPLRIETDLRPGEPDVVVAWIPALDDTQLGRVRTSWLGTTGQGTFTVDEFILVTGIPGTPELPLPLEQVELAAAHEMGHALGLPHSGNPRDLMFRSNTATRLSVDDYRAVEALYRMTEGAPLPRRP